MRWRRRSAERTEKRGSDAPARLRSERFDIDLAISSGNYLRCVAVALDSNFKVDVVDLDTVRPAFRDEIEQHGTAVYRA